MREVRAIMRRGPERSRLVDHVLAVEVEAMEAALHRVVPLAHCLARGAAQLEGAGVRVALVDVTSADVATGPFRVVRAVSPELQPIWYGCGLERNRVERLRRLDPAPAPPPIHPIW